MPKIVIRKKGEQVQAPTYPDRVAYRIAAVTKLADDMKLPTRAVQSNAYLPEDEFRSFYLGGDRSVGAIVPPYDLRLLDRLCQENNTLSPCVEVMVTNIDGTGFEFIKTTLHSDDDVTSEDDTKIEQLWGFFNEPWPGESFISQRKKMRRDVERTGNGYLEIMRTGGDEPAFMRYVDAKMIRIIRLDDPVAVKLDVTRGGVDTKLTVGMRYRKYVQLVNGVQRRYFKEFGCPFDLDKVTGQWAKDGARLAFNRRATELKHFIALPDTYTPYGVPRWINQLPSVLGSRKAEEFNLDYFDNGGVPPVMLLLSGGVLSSDTRDALERGTVGPAMKKNRVLVIESEPSTGSVDSVSPTKISVEKFGAEMAKDSMFEGYDDRCEIRVRRSFRIPEIFLGQAKQFSFASAYAAYTVAEAQAFKPERDEFDAVISMQILPAIGYPGYRMKSHGLKIEDATLMLQGVEIGQSTQQVDAEDVLDEVNKIVGTHLKLSKTLPVPSVPLPEPSISNVPGAAGASSSGARGVTAPAKRTQQGTIQSNSEKKTKPALKLVRAPAVKKSEEQLVALSRRLIEAAKTDNLEVLGECLESINELDAEDAEELRDILVDVAQAVGTRAEG